MISGNGENNGNGNSFAVKRAGRRLNELFDAQGASILQLCRLILRDPIEAEDAAQQTFLSAYRALLRGTTPREPEAWLAQIARNECRARLRRRELAAVPLEVEAEEARDVSDVAAGHEQLRAVASAIEELPTRQRQAVVLSDLRGLSNNEVARAMSLAPGTVEALLYRGRLRVRRAFRRSWPATVVVPVWLRDALVRLAATARDVAVGCAGRQGRGRRRGRGRGGRRGDHRDRAPAGRTSGASRPCSHPGNARDSSAALRDERDGLGSPGAAGTGEPAGAFRHPGEERAWASRPRGRAERTRPVAAAHGDSGELELRSRSDPARPRRQALCPRRGLARLRRLSPPRPTTPGLARTRARAARRSRSPTRAARAWRAARAGRASSRPARAPTGATADRAPIRRARAHPSDSSGSSSDSSGPSSSGSDSSGSSSDSSGPSSSVSDSSGSSSDSSGSGSSGSDSSGSSSDSSGSGSSGSDSSGSGGDGHSGSGG